MANFSFRKLLAFVLTLTMAVSACVCVFADETNTVSVSNENVTVDGGITIDADQTGDYYGLSVWAYDEGNAGATVSGTISISGEEQNAVGVFVYATDDGTSAASVQDVQVNTPYAEGVNVQAYQGGTATLEAGDITAAAGDWGTAAGVYADGEESSASLTADSLSGQNGVQMWASEQATAETTVNGDINGEYTGIYATSTIGGQAEVTAAGDVNAGAYGIDVRGEGSSVSITDEEFDGADLTLVYSYTDEYEDEYVVSVVTSVYEDGNGYEYTRYSYESEDGLTWNENYRYEPTGGTTVVKVDGNLIVEGEDASQLIYAQAESLDGCTDVTVGGDAILIRNEEAEDSAIQEVATDGGMTVINVEGSVASNNVTGVYLYGEDEGSELSVTIGGDLDIATEALWSTAIHPEIYDGAAAKVVVEGDVNSTSTDFCATGIFDQTNDATTDVIIGGDLNVTSSGYAQGVQQDNNDAEVNIYVGGNVTVASESESAVAVTIWSYNSENSLQIDGNVTATNQEDSAYGVDASSGGDEEGGESSVNITVGGDVLADGGTYAYGVRVDSSTGGEMNLAIDGDVTAKAGEYAAAVNADAFGADAIVEIGGDVLAAAEDYSDGVNVYVDYEGYAGVSVDGSITASADQGATGINVTTFEDGEAVVFAGGGVNAYGEDGATGIMTWADGGSISVTVQGDVLSDGAGIVMVADAESEDSSTTVDVMGDVIAEDTAISIELENDTAAMQALIDGTVSGEHSIVLTEQTVTDNLTLTVWEVVPNEAGNVVERKTEDGYEADTEAEKQIQYIIRVDGNNLSTEGTTEYEGYNVAHEGDTVLLKVSIPDGYAISGAFNGTDNKVNLEKDANGQYYLVVPKGGAVMLSVSMYKTEAGKAKDIVKAVTASADDGTVSVEVVKDSEANEKVVVVKPGEGQEKVALTLDAKAVKTLTSNGADRISLQSADGTAQADIEVKDLKAALDAAPKSELLIEMNSEDGNVETPENVTKQYDVVPGGIDVIRIVLKDTEGKETELPDAKVTLKIQVEYREGMKVIFIGNDGTVAEAESEWVEATGTEPGYLKVVYQGYGAYLPVMPK